MMQSCSRLDNHASKNKLGPGAGSGAAKMGLGGVVIVEDTWSTLFDGHPLTDTPGQGLSLVWQTLC